MSGAIDPGAFSLRMQVLEPTATDDELGGAATSYAAVRSLWALFDADAPSRQSTDPLDSALATGTLRSALGSAPPVGWRLSWTSLGGTRTVEVEALQRGTAADPVDLCRVREVAP